MTVVFPAPVAPTIATCSPAAIRKETSRSTQGGAAAPRAAGAAGCAPRVAGAAGHEVRTVKPAPPRQHERDRHRAQRLDEGEERRLELVGEVVRIAMVRVQAVELDEGARLAPGQRDRRHPRDRLLEVAVDAAD